MNFLDGLDATTVERLAIAAMVLRHHVHEGEVFTVAENPGRADRFIYAGGVVRRLPIWAGRATIASCRQTAAAWVINGYLTDEGSDHRSIQRAA